MEASSLFTVNDLATKFKAKSELINVLSREGNIYLPPKRDITQKYLRKLLHGEKLYIKWSEVIVINVPQYSGLRVKDLLNFAKSQFEIEKFLPDYDYNKDPNRDWLCNLINTVTHDKFNEFIDKKIKERNKKLINSQNLNINAKKEFIDIFKSSQSISTLKGKSHFLVRAPKQTKEQLTIQKLTKENEDIISKTFAMKRELDILKNKLIDYDELDKQADLNARRLKRLLEMGLIDENADPVNNDMS